MKFHPLIGKFESKKAGTLLHPKAEREKSVKAFANPVFLLFLSIIFH